MDSELYATAFLLKEIKLLKLAMEAAKQADNFHIWARFIRTREANITWYLNIQENGFKARTRKNGKIF